MNNLRHVPFRSLVRLHGADTVQFLQGMISNNMTKLQRDPVMYTAFLTPKGRVMYDAFIYKMEDAYWIEVDSRLVESFVSHMAKYRLRSRIAIEPLLNHSVWQQPDRHGTTSDALVSVEDVRCEALGRRVVLATSEQMGDGHAYQLDRMLLGVPEGLDDFGFEASLPQEFNMDYMNGIDFKKGCYVGQELTARTYHTGVVRKRVMPVELLREPSSDYTTSAAIDTATTIQQPQPLADIRQSVVKERRSTQKYIGGVFNVGLALLRIQDVESRTPLQSTVQDNTVYLRPWLPSWWPPQRH